MSENPPIRRTTSNGALPFLCAIGRSLFLGRRRLMLALMTCVALAPPPLFSQTLSFSVLGDTPYGDSEVWTFRQHMLDHNLYSPADFLIHVGDIFEGGTTCDEFRYRDVSDALRLLTVPPIVIPGDNETQDCDSEALGWTYWRTYFQGMEQDFCGAPDVDRQPGRPENLAFVRNGVLFIGLDFLGSSTPSQVLQDDADWVEQHFLAEGPTVRATVVFSHAGPNHGGSLFFDQFVAAAVAFGKPVLYVHGHGHSWINDKPFGVDSIRRIQVNDGGVPPVVITVTMEVPARFLIDQDPFDGAAVNATPCVDAGPDLWVASGQQAWLRGMASDDGDPGSASLSLTWSKVSGPGTVSFTNPNSAETVASFGSDGTYSLKLRGSDGLLATTDLVNVVVSDDAPNTPPNVANDSYSTPIGVTLHVPPPGILANDSDPEGTALTALLVTAPAHGTLTLEADGSFTYVPEPGFYGLDSFSYRASDGLLQSSPAGVGIHIEPTTLTLLPTEDTMGDSSDPNDPMGSSRTLRVEVDDTSYRSFLKFAVNGTGTTILSAKLRLFAVNGGPDGGSLYWISNYFPGTTTAWTEETLTWNNAPPIAGTWLGSAGDVDEDAWVEFDVSQVIRGDGLYSFGIQNASSNRVEYSSKEGSDPPVLLIETIPGGGGENHLPQVTNDSYELDEDSSITLADPGFLENDSDPDGDALRIVVTAPPTKGSLNTSPSGGFAYVPDPDQNGSDTFTYVADDNRGGLQPGTVTLQIRSVNDSPIASADDFELDEDVPLDVPAPGVLGNDVDVDGDNLVAEISTPPSLGEVLLRPDGGFLYTPGRDLFGLDQFTYSVRDGQGGMDVATVTLTLHPVQDAPLAQDDVYETDEDLPLAVQAPGVLQNDSDAEGDSLLASLETVPIGSVSLEAGGGFTYSPAPDFNGTDHFTYRVDDGHGGSSTAAVTLHVSPRNDPPVANQDDLATDEDMVLSLAAPGILANDVDVDGDPLMATLVQPPVHGSLILAAGGGLTYTPGADEHGVDVFRYRVVDGNGGSDTTSVVITIRPVNDSPIAVADAFVTAEDAALSVDAPGLLANDTDADGDALTAALVTPPAWGDLQWLPDGSFTYTPARDFHGTDTFTYELRDGQGGSATAIVTLSVDAVNDPPLAADDTYELDEDTVFSLEAPGLQANDADVDGDSLVSRLEIPPTQGQVQVGSRGDLQYTPDPNVYGTDRFTYSVQDPSGARSDAAVDLWIRSVNDPPQAVADSYGTAEDTDLIVPAPGLLGNDADVDGDALTATLLAAPAHGSIHVQADGAFRYTPDPDSHGSDAFTYVLSDGQGGSATASVSLNIEAVNDAPLAENDVFELDEDQVLTVPLPGVLANDSDVDGDALSVVLATPPLHGAITLDSQGSFTYTPSPDYFGSDTFVYRLRDPSLAEATGTVTLVVHPVNDVPVSKSDSYSTPEDVPLSIESPGVLANDVDPEGDTLVAVLESITSDGVLALHADGGFEYTPAADFHGIDSFTYHVEDPSGPGNSTAVNVVVEARNDAPVALGETYETDEDQLFQVAAPGILRNDFDVDGDVLTLRLLQVPVHGSLQLTPNGGFTFTPAPDFNGNDTFTYEVQDGQGGADQAMATITVRPVNDPPVVSGETYATDEDVALVLAAPGILQNDSDVDGDVLSAAVALAPAHGILQLASDGSLTYTPDLDFFGTDHFTYSVDDAHGGSGVAEVSIEIRAVNDAPQGLDADLQTMEDVPLHQEAPGALSGARDVEGDPLQAGLKEAPEHGTVVVADDGAFTYTPDADFNGADRFVVEIRDGGGGVGSTTMHIEVTPVQDAPVPGADSYELREDEVLSLGAPGPLANDIDVDGDPLVASLVAAPQHGTLQLQDDGAFTYVPQPDYNGMDGFTYSASDGFQAVEAQISLSVVPVNDAPLVTDDSWSGTEDTPLQVAAPGGLQNDTDVDGDSLTLQLDRPPLHGSLQVSPDGSFTYVPEPDFHGTDAFRYIADDGQGGRSGARVSLWIEARPDAPKAQADAFVVAEDASLDLAAPGVLANDLDVDGDSLQAILRIPPSHGQLSLDRDGALRYVPDPDWNGVDSFRYDAVDVTGLRDSTVVEIRVMPVNDSPLAGEDHFELAEDTPLATTSPGVLANDTDVDGDALQASLIRPPRQGQLDLQTDGSFLYTPVQDFFGRDDFEYRVTDGQGGTATAVASFVISPVNDAPRALPDTFTVFEDDTLFVATPGPLANDSDVEGEPLQVRLERAPFRGTLSLSADGSFTYIPEPDFSGSDGFTVAVLDPHGASQLASVTLLVQALNDAPRAEPDSFVVHADTAFLSPAAAVLGNDFDADGDSLQVEVAVPPQWGELDLLRDGAFRYTPAEGFTGPDAFDYVVTDGRLQDGAHVGLHVQGRGVTYFGSVSGIANQSDEVRTESSLAAVQGDLYVAALSSRPFRRASQVTGMGLDWVLLRSQQNATGNLGLEVWMARGTPHSDPITARFDAPVEEAGLAVARYGGVDPTDPVGSVYFDASQNSAASGYDAPLTTLTEGGILYRAVALRGTEHTMQDASFLRSCRVTQGVGETCVLAIDDRVVDAGTQRLRGSFVGATAWSVVAMEIRSPRIDEALPQTSRLEIQPNPARLRPRIAYTLYRRASVELQIFDARGRLVRRLLDASMPPGRLQIEWDGLDERGRLVDSGVYFLHLRSESRSATRKLVLIR